MKRFLVLVLFLFSDVAYAHTIDWYVDNQLYQTSTCTTGTDVILPNTPTKRGHTFIGWVPEHFNRGTYATWSDVPTQESSYTQDIHGNYTPLDGDYIIITDGYDFILPGELHVITTATGSANASISITNTNTQQVSNYKYSSVTTQQRIPGTVYYIRYRSPTWYLTSNSTEVNYTWSYTQNVNFYVLLRCAGVWKFVYRGVWSVDGKDGWTPDTMID